MNTKLITCPPLCGVAINLRGEPVEFGLVEYVQDVLLPGAMSSAELCDFLLRVMKACPPRGPEQVGKPIALSREDWTTLCAFARKERNPGSPENLVAFATCNRAILLATDAPAPAAQAAE